MPELQQKVSCRVGQSSHGHLDRLGGVLLLGEERRLGLLEERLRLLVLRLRGLSGLLALFLPLQAIRDNVNEMDIWNGD